MGQRTQRSFDKEEGLEQTYCKQTKSERGPPIFERDRVVVTPSRFLRVEGPLQNQDGVIHVKGERIEPLEITSAAIRSHDFH